VDKVKPVWISINNKIGEKWFHSVVKIEVKGGSGLVSPEGQSSPTLHLSQEMINGRMGNQDP
jgi:hypothetical protein